MKKFLLSLILLGVLGSSVLATADPPAVVKKSTVRLSDCKETVIADLFQPDFPVGDSNYNALLATSDGKIHFVVNTHNTAYGCRYFIFDPKTEQITLAGKLDEILKEPAKTHVPQGKVHVPLFEHKGKVWFATHTAFYHGELPEMNTGKRAPYSGGHFMSYDLKTGRFTDLAAVTSGEGIITMAIDKTREVLYGLTWPSGLLFTYNLATKELRCWGAVQGRGEWGQHPWDWDRICRRLAVAPSGEVYGSAMDGRIWKFDPAQYNPVTFLDGLDLSRIPASQSSEQTAKGDFENNWRAIEWNPATNTFFGILWDTTALFEFSPSANYLRSLGELRHEAYAGMPRNPESSQLGFMLGPDGRIFYLGHGPAVEIEGRPPVQSGLYLFTYDPKTGAKVNHGPVLSRDGRRVFFTESIAIGSDDHIYTVAWVEVVEPTQRKKLAEARAYGPAETQQMVYEMLLVRLPKWQEFSAP